MPVSISDLGRASIPGASPAGQDARLEADYVDLKSEIEKLSSISQAEQVDWARVVQLGTKILSAQSKDLLVAAYLSVGLAQVKGFQGIADALRILLDFTTTYWDDGFPPLKRIRGRLNAMLWWRDATTTWLKTQSSPDPLPPALHQDLSARARALDQRLADCLPDFPPLHELIEQLERLPVEAPPAPESSALRAGAEGDGSDGAEDVANKNPAETGQSPASSSTKVAPASKNDSGQLSAEGVDAAQSALRSAALDFAHLSRTLAPSNPWSWKANRLAAWVAIKQLPPNQGGKTLLPAPEGTIKTALEAQLKAGRHLEAAMAAEEHFTAAIFWLDLQYVIDQALGALGQDFMAARDALRGELTGLLARLPGLEKLSFEDGTAFADARTTSWIEEIQSAGDGAGGPRQPSNSVLAVLAEAEQLLAGENAPAALDCLTKSIREAADGPSRLRIRRAQMTILCRIQRFDAAAALAEQLLRELESRQLPDWDPELAAELLIGCYHSYVGRGENADPITAKNILEKLAYLKPSVVLTM
ncbi:type VI secretion-associated protein, family [Thiorhodovibrio winogradskyi]|uniref:Type VI secretion-associated protein, family n=1 Tax=Thiorhodovibrio winogradskyi TaxID=77007 RepID=A0ABZ0S950_9GAMM|nr:type VI secretion system protein TssA [Thiorhodovibrio winogradskyi]